MAKSHSLPAFWLKAKFLYVVNDRYSYDKQAIIWLLRKMINILMASQMLPLCCAAESNLARNWSLIDEK